MNLICITESYFFGVGLSHVAASLGRTIVVKSTLSKEELKKDDVYFYHLKNFDSVSINDLRYISQCAKLFILNDTYIQSSILTRYYDSITINARLSLLSVKKIISCKYESHQRAGNKAKDYFVPLNNNEALVIFKSIGGSDVREISKIMNLSIKSIYNYRRSALKKLGVKKIAHFICSDFVRDGLNVNDMNI